jgi:Xaa-Pro aminopeptidase
MFDAETYTDRRARLRSSLDSGLILFLGHDESPMNFKDNPYRFRQDSSFLYFLGLDSPGLAGVIDVDEGRQMLFGDDPTVDEIVWTGPRTPFAEQAEAVGVSETGPTSQLAEVLAAAREQDRTIHLLPPLRPQSVLELQRLLALAPEAIDQQVSRQLVKAVIAQRAIKSNEEIAEIEGALEITWGMHTEAMKLARPGVREQEVAGAVEGIAISRGGALAFPVIFSVRGEVLHNHSHGNIMQEGDLAIHDSGGESPGHYAGDITRTIPIGGRFSDRQKEIYTIVHTALEEAIAAVAPGVPFRDIHLLAARRIAVGLGELGLMRGDVEAAVEAGAHALFFPHGLGHMMGLDVHDMEGLGEDDVGYDETTERSSKFGLGYLRLARALQPGFVITVEPGIYFIPQLIDRWRAEGKHEEFIDYERVEVYRDFGGVRIEDDVVVLDEGYRILGRPIPREVEEVEDWASR